jgi:hypothetical protein
VDHALFYPTAEEPGNMELFLLGRDGITLVPLYVPAAPAGAPKLHALASFSCEDQDRAWQARRPGIRAQTLRVIEQRDLREVWQRGLGDGCVLRWYTPGGRLASGATLPVGDPFPRGGELPFSQAPRGGPPPNGAPPPRPDREP